MTRLNNKGITTIEVIICFILVVTITTSMYATVSSYNQKRIIEQYKEEIYTYKNLLTKEIQEDFIKIGLSNVNYAKKVEGKKTTHTVDCVMKDGTKRKLVIIQQFAKSSYHLTGSPTLDDYYMIQYGTPDDMIDYPIPKLGSTVITEGGNSRTVQDFSINNVWVTTSSDNVLKIYIGFYHPELGTRYGVQVIAPINYTTSSRDTGEHFHLY